MDSTPIARLAKRFVTRRDEPANGTHCGNCCRELPSGQGHWNPDRRQSFCDDACLDDQIDSRSM